MKYATENKIAKAMASNTGWNSSTSTGVPGNDQSLNNSSGFNAFPEGNRNSGNGSFGNEGSDAVFWSSTEHGSYIAWNRDLNNGFSYLRRYGPYKQGGLSVRFVRDASTATTKDYSDAITIYPNPTTSIINIEKDFTTAKVYDISGKELLKSTSKTIDLSELPSSIYLLRLYNKSNKVLGTSKFVKQ